MYCGALRIKYFKQRYSAPAAWRVGEPRPHNMLVLPFREALKRDWRNLNGDEVWIYPLAAQGGDVLRPTRHGTVDQIKNELGVEIFISGAICDIDDKGAHDEKRSSHISFFESVESTLEPLKNAQGYFQYRTLRGMRAGFIFETPVSIEIGQAAQKEIHAKLTEMLENIPDADVDRACLNLDRGQAAPFICKRGQPVPDDHPHLYIHPENLSNDHVNGFYKLWQNRLNQAAHSSSSVVSGQSKPEKNKKSGETASQNIRSKTIIPNDIEHLDRTEKYLLSRSAFWSFARWIHHEGLREDILAAIDQHLMDGARTEKEPHWKQRWIEDFDHKNQFTNIVAKAEDAPPEAQEIEGHSELLPITRTFDRGDDLELAEAIIATMGSINPRWHGDGLRRYDPEVGIWKMYGKHALRRIGMSAAGAVEMTQKGFKPYKVTNNKIKAAIEMIQSLTGAGEHSIFDLAPAGVVIGNHFVTVLNNQLSVQATSPTWYAIHRLDYQIPNSVLQYWTNEDTGQEPKRPPVFCDYFLCRSLERDPEEDELPLSVKNEIEAKITTIGEWLGLALLGLCTREATALVLHGQGSNGKSVLTSLITDLFGAERTAHLPPQQMSERFSRAQLFGAAVNVVSEMPESDLLASDTLKAVISGDKIEVEKKHQDPFSFVPRAAHVFAANSLPSSRDRSWGLWRRLVPIQFHRIFDKNDRDPDLKNKLIEESPQIVTWALNLAKNYLERGGYAHEDLINKWRNHWRQETDALSAFCAQCKIVDIAEGDELKSLWRSFRIWAEEVGNSGAAKMSKNQFARSIISQENVVKKRRGKQRKMYVNLKYESQEPSGWTQ